MGVFVISELNTLSGSGIGPEVSDTQGIYSDVALVAFALVWIGFVATMMSRELRSSKVILLEGDAFTVPRTVAPPHRATIRYSDILKVTVSDDHEYGSSLTLKSHQGLYLFDSRDFESDLKFQEFCFEIRARSGRP